MFDQPRLVKQTVTLQNSCKVTRSPSRFLGVRLCWELEEGKGPKGSALLSTEGRVVGVCWAHLKPKGPKGPKGSLTSVHWGKPLHAFGLTSEVSVVRARVSLTMGYHGPSADLLYPGVRASKILWITSTPDEDTL
jgi:hypothetical protein